MSDVKMSEFVETLPVLDGEDVFHFGCEPSVPCFNACCRELYLPLTPYDALRLRTALGMAGAEFLDAHTQVNLGTDTGVPEVLLAMEEDGACSFVRPEGCSVYADRPGPCRSYPIGRGARVNPEDPEGPVLAQYVRVSEDHCEGFAERKSSKDWTVAEWLADQGMDVYNDESDKMLRLLTRIIEKGVRLAPKQGSMVLTALYKPTAFRDFLEKTGFLDRVEISDERRALILKDDAALLEFAYSWLELVLFGASKGLKRTE